MGEFMEVLEQIQFSNDLWAITMPCVFIVIDFLTGFINAWVKGEISSKKMRAGLGKKLGEIIILIMAELVVVGTLIPIRGQILTGAALYIIVTELISIFENLELLGVPIPKFVRDALAQTSKKLNQDEGSECENDQ